MTDDPSHPVTCPRCGGVIGTEDDGGCLETPLGIVTFLDMVHTCGGRFHWDRPTVRLEKLIARMMEAR